MTYLEFIHPRNPKTLRPHKIQWEETTEPEGFNLPPELWEAESRQFSLSKERGRIHGFMYESLFYIVWIDPDHNLYP